MGSSPDEDRTPDVDAYEWPDEPTSDVYYPNFYLLALMYAAPFVILILFPNFAWIVLLPFALTLRWNAQPPHRRRLVWIYVVTGSISVAPWIAWILS